MSEMKKIMAGVCDQLDEYEHKGLERANGADWEMVSKLLEMKKNLLKIQMLEDDGYSMDNMGHDSNGIDYSRRNYSRDRGTYYSGRRHRDSMGRYSSAEDKMEDGIMTMMERSDLSQADKDTLRRALDVIRR